MATSKKHARKRSRGKAKRKPAKPATSRKATAKAASTKVAKGAKSKPAPKKSAPPIRSKKPAPKKPAPRRPSRKPVSRPAPRKKSKPKQTPAQIAAQKRAKARLDARLAAEAEHQRRLERRRELYKEKRDKAKREPPNEYQIAQRWLEHIRNDIAQVFDVTLEMTEAGGGHAELLGEEERTARRALWLIVGKFEPMEEIGYSDLAEGLGRVYADLPLMVAVGEQRLSQIRIVFHDPGANRREGDSVVSKIGAWDFVVSETIRELVGGVNVNVENPDDESLAGRYKETIVPTFYIFFSGEMVSYRNVSPSAKTATIRL